MVAMNTGARAADNCLRAPKDETPRGRHWYYRMDHANQRQCWYLGDEKDNVTRAAPQDLSPSANSGSPKPAPPQRSVADARAELPLPKTRMDQESSVFPAPALAATANAAGSENSARAATADPDSQASVVASRWPGTSDATPSAAPAPAPVTVASAAAAPSNAAAAPSAVAPSNAVAVPPPPAARVVPLAAADASTGKPSESILMLLAVVIGALSVAAVLGSAVFRLGSKRRRRRQRREIWGDLPAPWQSPAQDHAVPRAYPNARMPHARTPHDRADARGGANARDPRREPDDPDERIEEFLARLSR
jgi:hypothetical protein